MTESEYLFKSLDKLQENISATYYKTIEKLKEQFIENKTHSFPLEIVTQEQQDNQEFDLIVDMIDEVNGGIYSVYVLMINSFGEFIGMSQETLVKDNYSINDISNEYNKIEMIQLIEKYLNQ